MGALRMLGCKALWRSIRGTRKHPPGSFFCPVLQCWSYLPLPAPVPVRAIVSRGVQVHRGDLETQAVGCRALPAARALLGVPPAPRRGARQQAHASRQGQAPRIQGQAGRTPFCSRLGHCLHIPSATVTHHLSSRWGTPLAHLRHSWSTTDLGPSKGPTGPSRWGTPSEGTCSIEPSQAGGTWAVSGHIIGALTQ